MRFKTVTQIRQLERHGKVLQKIFPVTKDMDPLDLMGRLYKIEKRAAAIGLRLCNGPDFKEGERERKEFAVMMALERVLGIKAHSRIFVNGDPRGYALKFSDNCTRHWNENHPNHRLHSDWGGFGILCPEFN